MLPASLTAVQLLPRQQQRRQPSPAPAIARTPSPPQDRGLPFWGRSCIAGVSVQPLPATACPRHSPANPHPGPPTTNYGTNLAWPAPACHRTYACTSLQVPATDPAVLHRHRHYSCMHGHLSPPQRYPSASPHLPLSTPMHYRFLPCASGPTGLAACLSHLLPPHLACCRRHATRTATILHSPTCTQALHTAVWHRTPITCLHRSDACGPAGQAAHISPRLCPHTAHRRWHSSHSPYISPTRTCTTVTALASYRRLTSRSARIMPPLPTRHLQRLHPHSHVLPLPPLRPGQGAN